jgi:hypothetical protein
MNEQALKGLQDPESGVTEYNALSFLVRQMLAELSTSTLVKVTKVTNSGGVAAVGFVDVQPLVDQQDGFGNAVPHGVLHNLPYFRMQGGVNAVILDPAVGDIGFAVFADKDISVVKNTKKQASPGSARRFSMSDGIYLGGVLNGAPTNYVQFSGNDINITATGVVNVVSPEINLKNAGAALKKLVNETFLTLFDAHTHLYTPGAGTPAQTAAPTSPSVPTNATSVVKAE